MTGGAGRGRGLGAGLLQPERISSFFLMTISSWRLIWSRALLSCSPMLGACRGVSTTGFSRAPAWVGVAAWED